METNGEPIGNVFQREQAMSALQFALEKKVVIINKSSELLATIYVASRSGNQVDGRNKIAIRRSSRISKRERRLERKAKRK